MKGELIDLSRAPGRKLGSFDLVLLPVGSLEYHGPHLPLTTDTMIAEGFARRVGEILAEKGFRIALLPSINYGYTWSLRHHDGTASVDPHVLSTMVQEILVSLANARFSKFLIINGHGGNKEPLEVAVKEALLRLGAGISIGFLSWWEYLEKEDLDELLPGAIPSHACEVETSLMFYLCEDCVDLNEVEPVPLGKRTMLRSIEDARRTFSKGYLGNPSRASKEIGERLFERVANRISSRLVEELKEKEMHGIE
ncbi:hypothetical protein IPA_09425 [Ignicoccus pacificus DSM 13166]|uniref:Creatinine amidohydrolase n=1 Tax=Ignicoccus pacificus DSM 13166 TaxID=940294 RepID=A0A977KD50_9CREN|nr:hypothetical protein IPA_09425 [Ignicoccus pacificus DSM 13166]